LRNAFSRFFNTQLIAFFKEQGLNTKIERGGRVFPVSDRADTVLKVLENYLKKNSVYLKLNSQVIDAKKQDACFQVITKN